MPELPEVETVRRGLAPVLEGATIAGVELRRADLRFPFPAHMADTMCGARVETLSRRGKYLVATLTQEAEPDPWYWIAHLGMSGRFIVEAGTATQPGAFAHQHARLVQHDHVVLTTQDGARIVYNDPRRFGYMRLVRDLSDEATLAHMGPEPLGNGFHAEALFQALRGRSGPVKTVLLDQAVVAGLGNIYVCEALFDAAISPNGRARSLSRGECERLVQAIRDVLSRAIVAGGSSLRDHAAVDGSLGYFQHQFHVYGREGEPCIRTGCPGTIERQVQAGRSTFQCRKCQVRPRAGVRMSR